MPRSRAGFTLVELSIVLIIIGLLAGGVMAGRSLIRSAQVNSILTEYEGFRSAVQSFRAQYQDLPGDFTRATEIWGAASNCNWTSGTISSGKETCDGDGDGIIGGMNSTRQWEYLTFWHHLSNAGMVDEQFDGVTPPVTGRTSPGSAIKGAAWAMMGEMWPAMCFNRICYDNFLMLNMPSTSTHATFTGGITPSELYGLDKKVDDGKPASGMISTPPTVADCTQSSSGGAATNADAQYRLSVEEPVCPVVITRPFARQAM